jgi:NAD-dependent deacetylase sirtuin 1
MSDGAGETPEDRSKRIKLDHPESGQEDGGGAAGAAGQEDNDADDEFALAESRTKHLEMEMRFRLFCANQQRNGLSARTFLASFGMALSRDVDRTDDEVWEMIREAGPSIFNKETGREKLDDVNTLDDVVRLLKNANKIVVLTGAGISVSCGIPDFRSENGLYNRLGEYNLPNPQCMFDKAFFKDNPKPFFHFAREIFPGPEGSPYTPSMSHYFIAELEKRGKLLRNYTQNIDSLELKAGMSREKVSQRL